MFIRLGAVTLSALFMLSSCKTPTQSIESSLNSAGFADLKVVPSNAQNLQMDEARIVAAMKWIKAAYPPSVVPQSMIDGCLQNASGNKWSDIQAHYYCLLGKEERACFTGSLQGQDAKYTQNYPASYDRCVNESGSLFGVDFDKPLAKLDGNQGDVFKHIMFTNGHNVFCYTSQRSVIETFYKEIGSAVPKRAVDQTPDATACVGAAPSQPTPNPNQPTPNPNQPTPNPNQPTPNPNQPTPNPNQPTPNPNQPTPNPSQPTPNKPTPNQPTPSQPAPNKPPLTGGPAIAPNPKPNGPGITRVGMACPQVVGQSYYCATSNKCVSDAKACKAPPGNSNKLCGSVHQYTDLGGASLDLYNGSTVSNLHKVNMGVGRHWGNAISSVTVEKNCTLKLYQYFDFNINSSTGSLMNGYIKALDHDGRYNNTTRGRWEIPNITSQGVADNSVSSLVCDCF